MKKLISVLLLFLVPCLSFAVHGTDWIHKHPTNWAETAVEKYLHSKSIEECKQFVRQPEFIDPDFDGPTTNYWGYSTTYLPQWSHVENREVASVFVVESMNGGRDDEYIPFGDTYYVVRENGEAKIDLAAGDQNVNQEIKKWFQADPPTSADLKLDFLSKPPKVSQEQPSSETYDQVSEVEVVGGPRIPLYLKRGSAFHGDFMNYLVRARQNKDSEACESIVKVSPVRKMTDGGSWAEILGLVQIGWVQ